MHVKVSEFWAYNDVYADDMEYIFSLACIDWEKLKGKIILVTGGIGLIGLAIYSIG